MGKKREIMESIIYSEVGRSLFIPYKDIACIRYHDILTYVIVNGVGYVKKSTNSLQIRVTANHDDNVEFVVVGQIDNDKVRSVENNLLGFVNELGHGYGYGLIPTEVEIYNEPTVRGIYIKPPCEDLVMLHRMDDACDTCAENVTCSSRLVELSRHIKHILDFYGMRALHEALRSELCKASGKNWVYFSKYKMGTSIVDREIVFEVSPIDISKDSPLDLDDAHRSREYSIFSDEHTGKTHLVPNLYKMYEILIDIENNREFIKREITSIIEVMLNIESVSDVAHTRYTLGGSDSGESSTNNEKDYNKGDKNMEELKKIIAPLKGVFLDNDTLNEVIVKTSLMEVVNKQQPLHSGIVLYGKPGTGKTTLMKAIAQVYINSGAMAEELNLAQMSEKFIGSLANNLDERLSDILKRSEFGGESVFIFLDEATSLIMASKEHNESGVDYYQEAVDVLKKYISNYPNLVFAITTNEKPDVFDDALMRDGRLSSIEISYPSEEQVKSMWKHFSSENGIINLEDSQVEELSSLTSKEQGAFIAQFCKTYISNLKMKLELEKVNSNSLLDIIIRKETMTIDEVKAKITFDSLKQDLVKVMDTRNKTEGKEQKKKVGFALATSAK